MLFAPARGTVAEGERFAVVSREGALVVNNVAALGDPRHRAARHALSAADRGVRRARFRSGRRTSTRWARSSSLPMLLVMAVGPLLRWRRDSFARISAGRCVAGAVSAVAALVGVLALRAASGCCRCSGMALAAAVAVASLLPLARPHAAAPAAAGLGHGHRALRRRGGAVRDGGDSAFIEREAGRGARRRDAPRSGPWQRDARRASSRSPGPTGPRSRRRLRRSYDGGAPIDARARRRAASGRRRSRPARVALLTRWNGQLYAVLGEEARRTGAGSCGCGGSRS